MGKGKRRSDSSEREGNSSEESRDSESEDSSTGSDSSIENSSPSSVQDRKYRKPRRKKGQREKHRKKSKQQTSDGEESESESEEDRSHKRHKRSKNYEFVEYEENEKYQKHKRRHHERHKRKHRKHRHRGDSPNRERKRRKHSKERGRERHLEERVGVKREYSSEERPVKIKKEREDREGKREREENTRPTKSRWEEEEGSDGERRQGNSRDGSRRRDREHPGKIKVKGEESQMWGNHEENVQGEKIDPEDKKKPDMGLSGKLLEDTNTYNGVVIKYSQPPEARKPKRRWRWYIFKGDQELPHLAIHRQSAYLIGRDRKVADIPTDHPSCSKQHAVLQYRLVSYQRADGRTSRTVKPYIIDLESANGTYVNNRRIDAKRFVELVEKDVVKFGYSSREYVLLHEGSKDDDLDMPDMGVDVSPYSLLKSKS
ncbi:uncharacterized protein LOC143041064 isoform X2 [Oratosquilla oratoria]|uniref:uncharacterized protein LOC143041064 isoform X2 n=1 Tax=Oratosquilla oratoria TaxID=337810 RepID=UPI003F75A00F